MIPLLEQTKRKAVYKHPSAERSERFRYVQAILLTTAFLHLLEPIQGLDECAAQIDNCHMYADCFDAPEGFYCACQSGYYGDGVSCRDVDECTSRLHSCPSVQDCVNIQGSYQCNCDSGFEWSDTRMTCQDIDECQVDLCSTNGKCSNIIGSFRCTCNSGYSGDGTVCTDVNECTLGLHRCPTTGACINTEGFYTCQCVPGFEWNTTELRCKDIDECSLGTGSCSDDFGDCLNTIGSYTCQCIIGFSGDGIVCTGPESCPGSVDLGFLLQTANDPDDFEKQKAFLQISAAKFLSSLGNRASVSVFSNTTQHQISMSDRDIKTFINAVNTLTARTGESRVEMGVHEVYSSYFANHQVAHVGKVMVIILNQNSTTKSADLCPPYFSPFDLGNLLSSADIKVILISVGVGLSEDLADFVQHQDDVFYFNNYDELVSEAETMSLEFCKAAVVSGDGPYCTATENYCQANAECRTSRSLLGITYECQCDQGFKPEGHACVESSCPSGYSLGKADCEDIDECVSSPCSLTADCFNYPGSFTCVCKNGFRKFSPNACTDIYVENNGVLREVYISITGDAIEELLVNSKFPHNPDFTEVLYDFDLAYDGIVNYGQRLTTFYQPSRTGYHCFYLACSSACELWVSEDDIEGHMARLLKLEPWESVEPQQWERFPEKQASAPIHLSMGSFYFMRVYMKAGRQGGHVSVGVKLPSKTFQGPLQFNSSFLYNDACGSGISCPSGNACVSRYGGPHCTCLPGFTISPGGHSCQEPSELCPVEVDIVFLMDTSTGVAQIENLTKQRLFLLSIISRFNISKSRFSVIPFSDEPHEGKLSTTEYKTMEQFNSDLQNIRYLKEGCTRLDLVLMKAYNFLLASQMFPNAQKVLVLITTGSQTTYPHLHPAYVALETVSKLLTESKVLTYAVGIGRGVNMIELNTITADPSRVILVENFDELEGNTLPLYKAICKSSAWSQKINICPQYALVTNCQDNATCVYEQTNQSHDCTCDSGFQSNGTQCDDVDECTEGLDECLPPSFCINIEGSYNCSCPAGFSEVEYGCQDVDECSLFSSSCHYEAQCNNTQGSYECSCKLGLTRDGTQYCTDIDECLASSDVCHYDAYCYNNWGSYECQCVPGYYGNGSSCLAPEKCPAAVDIIFLVDSSGSVGDDDYEKEKHFAKILGSRYNLTQNSRAAVIIFSHIASLEIRLEGQKTALSYAMAVDNLPYFRSVTRMDLALRLAYDTYFSDAPQVNEPQKLIVLLTDGKQTRYSSMSPEYISIKDTAQLLQSKGARVFAVGIGPSVDISELRTVTEQESDIFMATEFNDLVARADQIALSTCGGALQSLNITICSEESDFTSCNFGAHCINNSGLFECVCKPGFEVTDSNGCQDSDECVSIPRACPADASCINAIGSFYCLCHKDGYTWNGSVCEDNDECARDWDDCDKKQTKCVNTPGSFHCACFDENYYAWNGETCADINECDDSGHCAKNATCLNLEGSFDCTCSFPEPRDCFGTILCDSPRVHIINISKVPDQPTRVELVSNYMFTGTFELRCAKLWEQNAVWLFSNPNLTDSEALVSGQILSRGTGDETFSLSRNQFLTLKGLNAVFFHLTVVQEDNKVTRKAYDKGYVMIIPLPIVARISGDTKRTRGNKQNIMLNGSESFDPHERLGVLDGMTFYWLCKKADEEFATEDPTEIPVVPVEKDTRRLSEGGCFGTGIGRLESTSAVVVLTASFIEEKEVTLVFKLIVTKDIRSGSDNQTVHVVEGDPPVVNMGFFLNDRLNPIPSAPLTITADYSGYSCEDPVEFQWTLFKVEVEQEKWLDVTNSLTEPTNQVVLAIDPYTLESDSQYRLELTVRLGNQTPSTNVQDFRTAALPSVGSCAITPETGEAVYTMFELSCLETSDNEDITYDAKIEGDMDLNFTLSFGSGKNLNFILPQGNVESDYLYSVKVFTIKPNGATDEEYVTVQVMPPLPKDANHDVFAHLEKNTTSFREYLRTMNSSDALGLITAMMITLQRFEPKTAVAKSSYFYETKYNTTQQKIALNEITVEFLRAETVESLLSVVLHSALMASVGRTSSQLSKNIKVALMQKLENLTAVLHSRAQDMKAEDERHISEGVHNLLYLTVQLLMTSSEASSVHGTDAKLTAEQLEAKEIVLKTVSIVRTLLNSISTRLAVSESPRKIEVSGLEAKVGRTTHCGITETPMNVSNGLGFELPPDILGNRDVEWVEYQVIRTKLNPYKWDVSEGKVVSDILSLELTDSKGEIIPVSGTSSDIAINLSLHSGNDSLLNSFFVRPLTMRYHSVEIVELSESMIVEVKPENQSEIMLVYTKYGERPTVDDYDHVALVPDFSSCLFGDVNNQVLAACSQSPYEVMSIKEVVQLGLYYVGVLYFEKGELNRTRVRRSCLGGHRVRRDCVEPKPPPVKGTVYNATLNYNPNTDRNYSVKVRKYSCYYFSLTQDEWSTDGCKVGDKTNDRILQCLCNHLTAFGGGFFIAPNPLDLDKVMTEFTRLGETENYLVLATVLGIFGVYLIVLIWARKADLMDKRKLGPVVQITMSASMEHTYEVTIVTGVWRNAGTTANVFLTIYGTEDVVEELNLTESAPDGRELFGRGNIDRFSLSLGKSIGTVVKIDVWHDNFGKNCSWFLDQIRIMKTNSGDKWHFYHRDWLAPHKGTGTSHVTLQTSDPSYHGPGFKNLFHSMTSVDLADYHIWASVVTRPPRNPFTRVQRLSCCLCFLYLAMVSNAMFYQVTGVSDEVIEIGPLKMSLRQVVIGIESALVVAPVNIIVTTLFRRRRMKTNSKSAGATGVAKSPNIKPAKGKTTLLFPHGFVYIAWMLCMGTATASATVTVFYSLQWGKDVADQWLASVVVSCVKDIFLLQPCKVFVFTLLLIIIFKRPKSSDEKTIYGGTAFSEEMRELRAYERQKARFFRFAREFGAFMFFYVLLMVVAYGDKDHHRYLMTKGTRDSFTFFDKANTGEKLWIYMLGKFIHDSYAGEWYNGQVEPTQEYIGDKVSMLLGMPRLRQLRILEGSCKVVPEFRSTIQECYDYYSMREEDTTLLYLPHWIHLSDSQLGWSNLSQLCPRPWRYVSAEELNNIPSWAKHHIYDGGGYVLDLGYDKPTAIRMIEDVKNKEWIDRRTRAILLEFQVLNLNTNLMSIVTYHYEVLPVGFGLTYERIDTLKLFNIKNLSYGFYMTSQLVFVFLVLIYASILFIRFYRKGFVWFKDIWSWVDVAQIASASLAIVFYVIKAIFMHESIKQLRQNPFITVSFQLAIFWTEAENAALSMALFIATFKILRFIRLNPHVQILAWTIVNAKADIFSFLALFGILFIAHAHFALMAFGSSVFSFSSFIRSFASEFEMSLGSTEYVDATRNVNQILGALFTTSFMVTMAVLVNIFVSILDLSLHEVKEDEEMLEEAFGIEQFIKTFLFGVNNKKTEQRNSAKTV